MALFAGVVVVVSFTGCDNTFTPFSERTDGLISISGFLNVNADTQFVRVAVLREEIEQVASTSDSISVELQDLTNLETSALTDSLIAVGDGQISHLFYTDTPIVGDREYRISATGPGGSFSWQTAVPGPIALSQHAPSTNQTGGQYLQKLSFPNLVLRPETLDIVYTVLTVGSSNPIRVVVPYRDSMVLDADISGYTVTLRLEVDRVTVMNVLGLPLENETTVLQHISAEYDLLSDEWRASRGPNELGFFASAASYTEQWTISDTVLREIGYASP